MEGYNASIRWGIIIHRRERRVRREKLKYYKIWGTQELRNKGNIPQSAEDAENNKIY